ncbi:MAG: MarR family transcriptional regulator, lower aerobic nicotinate degradation pathway regulator [Solirubrobacteraceae bacterium]|jgi:DNA-binding MarR family transcriptional regulator|nr:MarR family transcriptional regulator, lower aerobic nicotinate degradation pathway regulator [Solirubrobacteraceae bacterium]
MTRKPASADAPFSRLMEMPTWLITRASAYSHELLADGFAAVGSRGYHYRLLAGLEEFGPASQADLGRRTGIDRSDVVAALNELADRGFIKRSPDPDDGRRNVVTITPAGTKQLRALDEVLAGIQEKLLAPLSAADRTRFVRLLTRLLEDDARV